MCTHDALEFKQAWQLRMEKSAEKWGPGGRRRPSVGVQRATTPVGVRGRSSLKLKLKLFNKSKMLKLHKTALHLPVLPVFNLV